MANALQNPDMTLTLGSCKFHGWFLFVLFSWSARDQPHFCVLGKYPITEQCPQLFLLVLNTIPGHYVAQLQSPFSLHFVHTVPVQDLALPVAFSEEQPEQKQSSFWKRSTLEWLWLKAAISIFFLLFPSHWKILTPLHCRPVFVLSLCAHRYIWIRPGVRRAHRMPTWVFINHKMHTMYWYHMWIIKCIDVIRKLHENKQKGKFKCFLLSPQWAENLFYFSVLGIELRFSSLSVLPLKPHL
jgi:hypothetical protein